MSLVPRQFLKGASLSAAAAVLTGIFGYLTRRFMANQLPDNDYAFFYSVFSLLSLSSVLLRAVASEVVLYEMPGLLASGRHRTSALIYRFTMRFQLILAGIGFLLLCLAIPFLKRYFFTFPVSTGNLLLFFTVVFALVPEDTTLLALNSLKKFGAVSFLRLFKTGAFCLAVWLCLRRGGLFCIIASLVVITTLCTFAGDRAAVRIGGFSGNRKSVPRPMRHRILLGGLIYLALSAGHALYRDFGALAVAFFSMAEEVVLFNIALPIAMIVLSFGTVLQVFTPMLADCFVNGEKERLRRLIRLMLFLTAAVMLAALPVLYFFGEEVIRILFSDRIIAAKTCTLFLVEAAILTMPVSVLHSFFNAAGQKVLSIRTLFPAAAAAFTVFPLLAHARGAEGAGIASLIMVAVWLGACLFYYVKFMRSWTGNE